MRIELFGVVWFCFILYYSFIFLILLDFLYVFLLFLHTNKNLVH